MKQQDNWIFGANIPGRLNCAHRSPDHHADFRRYVGKKRCLRFYFGGMQAYRERLAECAADGYAGFKPLAEGVVGC